MGHHCCSTILAMAAQNLTRTGLRWNSMTTWLEEGPSTALTTMLPCPSQCQGTAAPLQLSVGSSAAAATPSTGCNVTSQVLWKYDIFLAFSGDGRVEILPSDCRFCSCYILITTTCYPSFLSQVFLGVWAKRHFSCREVIALPVYFLQNKHSLFKSDCILFLLYGD